MTPGSQTLPGGRRAEDLATGGGPPSSGSRARRLRLLMILVTAVLVTVLAVVGLTIRWFVVPTSGVPDRADAVVVLAGGAGERLERGLALIDAGVADVLVLNRGVDWFDPEGEPVQELCDKPTSDFEVICVAALPDSTKGEAQTIAEIAESRQWRRLALVTTDHHLTRSTRWFERCFSGQVLPVAADAPTALADVEHEWLGTVAQLLFDRTCR